MSRIVASRIIAPRIIASRIRALLGCLMCAAVLPTSADAQTSAAVSAPPASQHRLEIVDPSAIVTATTLLAASGTSDDPAGLEGLTWTVVDGLARALREIPGVLAVDALANRSSVRFTLTTTPDASARADSALHSSETLLRGLPEALQAARRRFTFTAETPTAEVDLEAARLFAGFGSTWARPQRGSAQSVAAITSRAAALRWEQILAGASWREVRVGPGGPTAGMDRPASETVPASTGTTAPATTGAATTAPATTEEMAWATGDRVRIVREVTNVWIVAAFPIPADLPRTSLDHLLHRVEEIITPVPGDPGLIAAGAEVTTLPQGRALVIRATVLPIAARRWEERIRTLPSDITPPFDPDFFRWERRRFRAHLLLGDADPARRSARLAEDLLLSGDVRALDEEAWALEPDDLANAAARLGPPRVLVFGPDLGGPDAPAEPKSRQD